MKIPEKKLKKKFRIPVLGIGTWGFGGEWDHNPKNNDAENIKIIRKSIESGLVHIDTAELYARGYSEVLVGKSIEKYEREKLFIASKISPHHLGYSDVKKATEKSLQRLNTEYLDLSMIHFPNPEMPLEATINAMNELKGEGKNKNIGVSNFQANQLMEAESYSENGIVVNQIQYNLIYRESEKNSVIQYCIENDIIVVAWKPVQLGILSKKGTTIIDNICKKYNKTPAQVAINWLISQDNVVAICKMGNQKHLEENLGAVGWNMDKKDIEDLRQDFPNQKYRSEAFDPSQYPTYQLD